MARIETVNVIVNRAALEVGLTPSNDVVADTDQNFAQLVGLLNSAGQELIELYPWQTLVKDYTFSTSDNGATGTYPLPDDFCYMIDQTGWDLTNKLAVGGPLSDQDWTYLAGRDLSTSTIYVSFQLSQGQMQVYPQPPPTSVNISFRYVSRDWASGSAESVPTRDTVALSSDLVYYEPVLIVKYLKAKFLESKGFDAGTARLEFENMFNSRTGKDRGAPVLSAGNIRRGFPYLNPYYNTPDTNYGV